MGEEEEKIAPVLASSMNPKQYGNTVRGIVMLAAAPAVIQALSALFGVVVPVDEVTLLANELGDVATQVALTIGSVWTTYGLLMKAVGRVNKWLVKRKEA